MPDPSSEKFIDFSVLAPFLQAGMSVETTADGKTVRRDRRDGTFRKGERHQSEDIPSGAIAERLQLLKDAFNRLETTEQTAVFRFLQSDLVQQTWDNWGDYLENKYGIPAPYDRTLKSIETALKTKRSRSLWQAMEDELANEEVEAYWAAGLVAGTILYAVQWDSSLDHLSDRHFQREMEYPETWDNFKLEDTLNLLKRGAAAFISSPDENFLADLNAEGTTVLESSRSEVEDWMQQCEPSISIQPISPSSDPLQRWKDFGAAAKTYREEVQGHLEAAIECTPEVGDRASQRRVREQVEKMQERLAEIAILV